MADVQKQISVVVADEVGRLAQVADAIKDAGVNITALAAWTEGPAGHLMAITSDNDKACAAVTPLVDSCEFNEVVCVCLPNEPGQLGAVARKLADAGIDIKMVYATAGEADRATIVLITDDNARAAELL